MRLGLFSDIHANWPAWEACVAHAQAQALDRWAVLGDSVGYGAEPERVVRDLMERAAAGAIVLLGNHDQLAVAPPLEVHTLDESGAAWTHQHLSDAAVGFLAQCPAVARIDDILLVHATADDPLAWRYASRAEVAADSLEAAARAGARYVFCGHVHQQLVFYRGAGRTLVPFVPTPEVSIPVPRHRLWLACVGSVGQPRDGDARAMYAVLDTGAVTLTFHRVDYDQSSAAAAIRRAGLPVAFAERLERGE